MPTVSRAYSVTLPVPSDVYKVIPDALREPDDLRRTRADRAARLADSPTPEIVRGAQAILTTLDDVQDAFVTASLATRLAVSTIPSITPTAKLLATAADVLNLSTLMRGAGLVGGSHKASLYRHLATQPRTYSSRLRSTLRTGRVKPTFGELLQVLQTADSVAGIGLELGGIIGLPIELLSLAARGGTLRIPAASLATLATMAPLLSNANPWIKAASLATGYGLSALLSSAGPTLELPIPAVLSLDEDVAATQIPPAATISSLTVLESAEQILSASPLLDVLSDDLSAADHYTVTMARACALSTVAPWYLATGGITFLREYSQFPLRRLPEPARPTRAQADQPRLPFPDSWTLPLPDSPLEILAGELPDQLLALNAPAALGWIDHHPTDPRALQAAALAGELAATIGAILEGPEAVATPTWTPAALAAARAVEYDQPPELRLPE